jgi:hypothetical protein
MSDVRRRQHLRRALNDLFMRDGAVQESKLFSVIGKGICAYIMLAFTEVVLLREWVLAILLMALIAPDLLKKVITMRAGMRSSSDDVVATTTTRTELTVPADKSAAKPRAGGVDSPEG